MGAALSRQPLAPDASPVPPAPPYPVRQPSARAAATSHPRVLVPLKPWAGPLPLPALLGGERGLADPSSFSFSFNFRLLLKGPQSSGPKSLGSPLESAAGGSFSRTHLHSTPASLGADQDTAEGGKPHSALTRSPSTGLRHCPGRLPSGAAVLPPVGRMGGAGLVISGVWLSREAASPTPLAPEPLNVDCGSSEPLAVAQPKPPFCRQEH